MLNLGKVCIHVYLTCNDFLIHLFVGFAHMILALQWFAFTYTWTFDCVLTHNIVVETGQLEIYSTGSFFPYWTLQNMNVQLLSLTWKPKPRVIRKIRF